MHRDLITPYTDPQIPDTHRHTNSPTISSFTHTQIFMHLLQMHTHTNIDPCIPHIYIHTHRKTDQTGMLLLVEAVLSMAHSLRKMLCDHT